MSSSSSSLVYMVLSNGGPMMGQACVHLVTENRALAEQSWTCISKSIDSLSANTQLYAMKKDALFAKGMPLLTSGFPAVSRVYEPKDVPDAVPLLM